MARLVTCVVQCVCEIDARSTVRKRLFDGISVFDDDVRLIQQMAQNRRHLGLREAVVATHDLLQKKNF